MSRYAEEFRARLPLEELNRLTIALPLGAFQIEVVYWGVIGSRYWRNYLHTHSFFEVCHVYVGEGTFTVAGQTQRVRKGDMFVARPGQAHEIISDRRRPLGIWFWAFTMIPVGGPRRWSAPNRKRLLH